MKKLLAIILVCVLILTGGLLAYAMAETAETTAHDAPLVDLTGVIIAVLALVFDFLLAWIARVIIPPIKEWLATHTTEKQRGLLWDATCKLVDAAEQIIKGPLQGERRLAYVEAGLQQRGLTVDTDLIEAAVKQMNDRLKWAAGTVLDATEDDATLTNTATFYVDENGRLDVEITHWSLAQLRGFCELNGIPAEGCTTREGYIAAIVNAAAPVAEPETGCAQRDYCELDDNGNPIPEEPQSTVE